MTTQTPLTLSAHLAAISASPGVSGAATGAAFQAFAAALASDPTLRARAQTTLDAMDPQTLMRDHVSRWTKRVIETAMNGG